MLGRGALNTVYRAMGKMKYVGENIATKTYRGVNRIGTNMRKHMEDIDRASKNFRNRKSDTHYHASTSYWKDHTD